MLIATWKIALRGSSVAEAASGGLFSRDRQQHTQFPPTFYAVVANGRGMVVEFSGEDKVCPKFCEVVLDEEVLWATPFPSSLALGRVVSI